MSFYSGNIDDLTFYPEQANTQSLDANARPQVSSRSVSRETAAPSTTLSYLASGWR
jgi:hypothetical protein